MDSIGAYEVIYLENSVSFLNWTSANCIQFFSSTTATEASCSIKTSQTKQTYLRLKL